MKKGTKSNKVTPTLPTLNNIMTGNMGVHKNAHPNNFIFGGWIYDWYRCSAYVYGIPIKGVVYNIYQVKQFVIMFAILPAINYHKWFLHKHVSNSVMCSFPNFQLCSSLIFVGVFAFVFEILF